MSPFPKRQLHVLTDPEWISDWTTWAREVSSAGADVIQYRNKLADSGSLFKQQLGVLKSGLVPPTRLVVNDSIAFAVSTQADGVHLGATDAPVSAARRAFGKRGWIGRTANTLEEAVRCDALGADYLGIGPFRVTTSKVNPAPTLGTAGLAEILAVVRTPVIAIGGIRLDDLPSLFTLPIHGVAILGAITKANDPGLQTGKFREAIDRLGASNG